MTRKPPFRAVAKIDPDALASFQAGIRKRYSNAQILQELRASAERLGRSPTMREFAADPETSVHPQTVIEHFGSWNAAKREAGLVPRRFATREELVGLLRDLGTSSAARRRRRPRRPPRTDGFEVAVLAYLRLAEALREAGFDVPVGDERLDRAVEQGAGWRGSSNGCRSSQTGQRRGRRNETLLTEWQVYRMFDARRGAWSTFQLAIKERLEDEGRSVGSDGRLR